MSSKDKSTIKQTSIVGGVQVIRLATGLIRNKLLALFFGAQGVGIWAICLSFSEMMQQAAFMGLGKAGVKKVSENFDNPEERLLAIKVIRLSFLVNSLIIALAMVGFSGYLDKQVFSQVGSGASIFIALYLVFNCNAICHNSLLNGLREIRKYALSQLFGVLIGNLLIFTLLPFVTQDYLPHCFVVQGISNFMFSLVFFYKTELSDRSYNIRSMIVCFRDMLKVGVGFWLPALYLAFIEYMIRQYLMDSLNVETLGIYQACWTISNMYVGIILSSMGVVLFPKLCQLINDRKRMNSTINEQICFGLLVSTPFVLIIFLFAPEVLTILYSSDFSSGESVIHWQLLGVIMRLIGFPFGYALMAKGKSIQYVVSQFIFSSINYVLVILVIKWIGFDGLGINYFLGYSTYLIISYILCYRAIRFSFDKKVMFILIFVIAFLAASFCAINLKIEWQRYMLATGITVLSLFWANRSLIKQFDFNAVKLIEKRLLK